MRNGTVIDSPTPNSYVVGVTIAAGEAAPSPVAKGGPTGGSYDPGEHTVDEVQAYVSKHPNESAAILTAESKGKNRTTLVAWLEESQP